MLILDFSLALLALDVVRDQFHGSRTVERDQSNDVVKAVDVELLTKIDHPTGFQLEHANRFAAVQQIKGGSIAKRDRFEREIRLPISDQSGRILQNRERFEPEKIHLQHAE